MVGGMTRVSFLRTTAPFPTWSLPFLPVAADHTLTLFRHRSSGSLSFLGRDCWVSLKFFRLGGMWFCLEPDPFFSSFDLFSICTGGEGACFRRRKGACSWGMLCLLFFVLCCFMFMLLSLFINWWIRIWPFSSGLFRKPQRVWCVIQKPKRAWFV